MVLDEEFRRLKQKFELLLDEKSRHKGELDHLAKK